MGKVFEERRRKDFKVSYTLLSAGPEILWGQLITLLQQAAGLPIPVTSSLC